MFTSSINVLGDITPGQFLKEYWQKKPLIIRRAIPGYQCPVTPEELAGLACEEGVESRLVIEKDGKSPWQVKHGPLANKDFKKLPASHWSLLVQRVDHYDPRIASLLDHFRFIPNWRIDDVMISYAPEHGSVGPHLDSYDVFLLQGMGKRRWQVNRQDYSAADFIPDLDLRILREFHPEEEWTLEAGDMLYLPPGVAHHGVALEPCLTLSIGFLAPATCELLQHYATDILAGTALDKRYSDDGLSLQEYPGEITADSLDRIQALLSSALNPPAHLGRWFGRYVTSHQDHGAAEVPDQAGREKFIQRFRTKGTLCRQGSCRTAFIREGHQIILFINGEEYPLEDSSLPLAKLVTGDRYLDYRDVEQSSTAAATFEFLHHLYQRGIYFFSD